MPLIGFIVLLVAAMGWVARVAAAQGRFAIGWAVLSGVIGTVTCWSRSARSSRSACC
jgi:hypothetical protein